jgi:hypothetical protein
MDCTFWMALNGSLGHTGQLMRFVTVSMAFRSGIMTCGKANVGTDCKSVIVRYVNDRQVHVPIKDWSGGEP